MKGPALSAASLRLIIGLVFALTISIGQPQLQAQELCGSDNYYNCHPGDANGDGTVGISDAVYVITYIFGGGSAPHPWSKCNGDANGDCVTGISDVVYMITYIFAGGDGPISCSQFDAVCTDPGDYNPGPWVK